MNSWNRIADAARDWFDRITGRTDALRKGEDLGDVIADDDAIERLRHGLRAGDADALFDMLHEWRADADRDVEPLTDDERARLDVAFDAIRDGLQPPDPTQPDEHDPWNDDEH